MSAAASSSSDDDEFGFQSNHIGSKRYPVHDCCEFEGADALRKLIFVPQDDSDDDSDGSEGTENDEESSSDENDTVAAANAAMGHCPAHEMEPSLPPAAAASQAPVGATAAVAAGMGANAVPDTEVQLGSLKEGDDTDDAKDTSSQDDMETNGHSSAYAQTVAPGLVGQGEEQTSQDAELPQIKTAASVGGALAVTPEGENASVPMKTSEQAVPDPSSKIKVPSHQPEPPEPQLGKDRKRKRSKDPTYYCPFDLNEKDEDENTPLHVAVHARKLEHVKLLLQAGASPNRRSDGSSPIHTAISLGAIPIHTDFAYECVKLLVEHDADLTIKDESGHTPLALACMMNLPEVLSYILSDEAGNSTLNTRCERLGGRALHVASKFDSNWSTTSRTVVDPTRSPRAQHHPDGTIFHSGHQIPGVDAGTSYSRPVSRRTSTGSFAEATVTRILLDTPEIEVDATNMLGQTPLHIACSRGNWPVVRVLLRAGASPTKQDRRGLTPGQLAHKRGMHVPGDLMSVIGNADVSRNPPRDLIVDPDGSTLLMCHELCILHRSCPPIRRDSPEPPPENVRRLHVLIDEDVGILRSREFDSMAWESEARRAAMTDILKVHEYGYVESISLLCSSIPDHPSAIAHLDADTAVSRWSFEAAMRAAGGVCEAVDKVVAGDFRNAFCPVRPPGHHAGPRGIVRCANDPEGGSHGFCLLNNVAIGAAYARTMYRHHGIRKIAIVDFDVHHGNGTEEIIRQLLPTTEKTLIRTPFATGELSRSKFRPWLDETDVNDVFFSSTHGFGPRGLEYTGQPQQGWFYPASGPTHTSDAILNPSLVETPSVQEFILSQSWTRMGEESRANCCKIINCGLGLPQPDAIPGMQRLELRDTYRKKILPHLRDFDPDIIFVSAGFDGHKRDSMNFGYVGMVEEDYEWVTEQLVKIANTCCEGRIVSVLEGGYKIHGGIVSPFARSVASHVRALVDGGRSRELYDPEDGNWESQFERHVVEDRERKKQIKLERLRKAEARFRSMASEPKHQEAEVDDLMKAPLNEKLDAAAADTVGVETDEPVPKRRRKSVDYKKLLEEMQRDGSAG